MLLQIIATVLDLTPQVVVVHQTFAAHHSGIDALAGYGTAALALFTVVLATAAVWQTVLARKEARLTRRAFIAVHRPRLIVRNVQITLPPSKDYPIDVRFMYINTGDTVAKVESVGAFIYVEKPDRKVKRDYSPRECVITRQKLNSGEFEVASTRSEFSVNADIDAALHNGELQLCIAGSIIYCDENGVRRRTGFARCCDLADPDNVLMRFEKIDDEEYEYTY